MKRKSKTELTRRQTLSLLGTCGLASLIRNPVDMLVNGMVDGIIQKAQAESGGAAPRNYLFFYLAGGPNRWVFDLPLSPNQANDVIRHPHVNTKFGANLNPVYSTVPITHNGVTLHMPSLWACNLPTVGGGTVPMAKLMDGALFLRGVNMTSDGHDINTTRQIRPTGAAPSLNGAVADAASTPIPAVATTLTPAADYKSARGVGLSNSDLSAQNPLGSVLQPFDRSQDRSQNYLSRREAVESSVSRALDSLGAYANSTNPGAEGLFRMRHRAEKLLREGVGNTAGEYVLLRNKYRDLIRAVASSTIPGVSDRAIPYRADMNGSALSTMLSQNIITRNTDLRTLVQADTSVTFLAESFAVAEYLVTRGYSSSVMGGISSVNRVHGENIFNIVTEATAAAQVAGYSLDEHFHGSVVALIVDSFFFRSLAACLYELIQVLKAKNLYDETVIHIGSEFSRIPRADQAGSDHGWSAGTTSLFSGAINKPVVIGNTLKDGANSPLQKATGSWGSTASMEIDAQKRPLHFGNAAATIAELLRVKRPMPNYSSLIAESGSGISLTVDAAKNKEEA